MQKMVSMKLSGKEATAEVPMAKSESPAYPYGLRIELGDEAMKKLGLSELPNVGEKLSLIATVVVERVAHNETKEGGSRQDMSLQITEMCLGDHEKEDEEKDESSVSDKLYGIDGKEYKPQKGKTLLVDL